MPICNTFDPPLPSEKNNFQFINFKAHLLPFEAPPPILDVSISYKKENYSHKKKQNF